MTARLNSITLTVERIADGAEPSAADRRRLQKLADLLRGTQYIGTGEAKDLLGVGSVNTVKSLINHGLLKGSFRLNDQGDWQIPLRKVLDLVDYRQAVASKNAAGDLRPSRSDRAPRRLKSF